MTDIVEMLRTWSDIRRHGAIPGGDLMAEAADEIERLRSRIEDACIDEMAWIDMTVAPPPKMGLILALDRRPIVLGWSTHYHAWIDPKSGQKYKPTHWAEIPDWTSLNIHQRTEDRS